MYRRELPEPTERNREIYEAVAHDGKKQKDVAATYGLSQPMISKIVSQYEDWIVAHAPNENLEPHEREFVAANAWCDLLTRGKRMALDGYEASCQDRLLETKDGVRGRWIPAKRDMKCVKTLTDCAEKFLTATKARESSRHLLIAARDRDPQYQAEQARLRREESERRVDEQKRRDREAVERSRAPFPGTEQNAENGARLHSTMAGSTPLTNAAPAVINSGADQTIPSEKGDSKRLYEIDNSKTLVAESVPSRPPTGSPGW